MRKQREFKQTEIGRIPKDWEVVTLEEVMSLFHNGIWGEEPIVHEKSYPVIRSTEITRDGKIDLSNVAFRKIPEEKVSKYNLKGGDILLVASSGSSNLIGRAAIFKQPRKGEVYLFSNFMLRLRPENVDSIFLYYYLNSPRYYRFLKSLQQTSTGLRNLPKREFIKFKLPLPPLPEQQKIAEILSTVDEAIEKVDNSIEKTKRLKNGLMCELLTKGIGHKEFKDTEIGRIPKEWEVSSLSKIIKLASGKTRPSEIADMPSTTMPHPVYGGNGILGYTNTFIVDKETIVIGRVGEYCGSIHKTLGLAWITDNALYAVEIQRGSVELDYLIYSLAFINLNKFKKKSGQPLMTQKIIYSISIPLPPLAEQQKIAEILSTVDKRLELLRSKKEKLERIKKGLMNELLTGQRRVKILES